MKALIIAVPQQDNANGGRWQQGRDHLWTLGKLPDCKGWDLRWPIQKYKTAALQRCEQVGDVRPLSDQLVQQLNSPPNPPVLLTQRGLPDIERLAEEDFCPVTMIKKLNGLDRFGRLAGSVEQLENQLLLRTENRAGERGVKHAVWRGPVPPREADSWLNPAIAIIDLESKNIAPQEEDLRTPGNELYDFLKESWILVCEPLQSRTDQRDELVSLLGSAPCAAALEGPRSVLEKLFFSPPDATPGFRKEAWRRFWALDQLGGTFFVSKTCSGEPKYRWMPRDNLTPIGRWYVEHWWKELLDVECADAGAVFPYGGPENNAPRSGVARSTILIELPQPKDLGCESTRISTWHWEAEVWLDLVMSVERGDTEFKDQVRCLGNPPPKSAFRDREPISVAEIDVGWWQRWLSWLWYGKAEDGFQRTGPMCSQLGELILGMDTLGSECKSYDPERYMHF